MSAGRGGGRKAMQLSSQVRRALDVALHGGLEDPFFDDLDVFDVTPLDESRLRVRVVYREVVDRAEAEMRLDAARPVFLHEIASSIRRRKLPELVFELWPEASADRIPGNGSDPVRDQSGDPPGPTGESLRSSGDAPAGDRDGVGD